MEMSLSTPDAAALEEVVPYDENNDVPYLTEKRSTPVLQSDKVLPYRWLGDTQYNVCAIAASSWRQSALQ